MTSGIEDTTTQDSARARERAAAKLRAPAPGRRPPAPAAVTVPGTSALLMATAVADGGGPAAALPWQGGTVLGRLLDQLGSLGVTDVEVVTRPGLAAALEPSVARTRARVVLSETRADDLRAAARVARAATGDLVVCLADLVTQRQALAGLLADPRLGSAILIAGVDDDHPFTFPSRARRGRVVSASSPHHVVSEPNHRFLGVMKVAHVDLEPLARAAETLVAVAGPGAPEAEPPRAAAEEDVTSLLLVGLVRSGRVVGNSFLRRLYWSRPLSAEDAERASEEIAGYDEDQAMLDSAVKGADGFFTTFFVSPYSKYIARWAARRGLTPNQVTVASLVLGVLAAAGFATGERWGLIAGAVLLQVAFTTDCVDGQLARYTRTFSKLGAWLDSIFDRTKEYVVFAGLAIGASQAGEPAWLLAGAAITLQTARHTMEFSWAATMHQQIEATDHPPLHEAGDRATQRALAAAESREARKAAPQAPQQAAPLRERMRGRLRRGVAAWTRLDDHPRAMWFKRIVAFPIGERFAVISLAAALSTPRTTFVVLLACGGFAALYSVTGRVLRSIAR